MALLQAAIIGLIALIVAPGQLFYFDVTPKIVVLLAGAAALLMWPRKPAQFPAPRVFTLLVAASMISLAVSTAVSTNPALSLFGTNWRRFGAMTQAVVLLFAWLVARAAAGRPDGARIILRGIAASGAATAVYGIAQYFDFDPFQPKAAYHIGEGLWTIVRPPGTLGHAGYFATWLLAVVFLSLAAAQGEPGVAARRACYAAAALAAIAIPLTGTRAAMLGLAAGGAVWLLRRGFRVPRRTIGIAAAALLAGVAFYYSPPGWPLRSRTRWFIEDPWGGARMYLWRDSAAMGAHRPLGYGPEVFTAEFPRFESKALAAAYPNFLHESPHNIFLDAWVSQGIPGFLLLAAFCWAGFRAAGRHRPWLAAALVAMIVSQMFTVFTMPTALVFYVTIAIAAAAATKPQAARPQPFPAWSSALQWAIAIGLIVISARLTVADRDLQLAREALDRGEVNAAAANFSRYDGLRFPGPGSDLWYSRACAGLAGATSSPVVRVQAMAQAAAAAVRATRTAEEPFNAWYNLSAIYAVQNDFANTEKSLREAIAARPNWYKPHWMLAQVLRLEGRANDAGREAQIAADLDGGKDPEVSRTLREIRQQP